jgi:hypothetical protein
MTERERLIMNAQRLEWLRDAGLARGTSSLAACGGAKEQLILLSLVIRRAAISLPGHPHHSTNQMPPAAAAMSAAAPPAQAMGSRLAIWPMAVSATP